MLLVQHATQKRKFLSSPAILKWFGCILKLLTISCVQHLLAKQLLLQYQQRKQKGCSNELDSLPYNDNSQKPNTYSTVFPTYTKNQVVAKWSKLCNHQSLIKFGFLRVRVQLPFWSLGLGFSVFKILKSYEFEFFESKKIASKLVEFSSLRVREKILTKIWPKCIFFWQQVSIFRFFRVRVLAIFRDRVFFRVRIWKNS